MMRYPRRNQYKHTKKPYRIRNWSEYEKGLRNRGNLTIWISKEAIEGWRAKSRRKRSGQQVYSNLTIKTGVLPKYPNNMLILQFINWSIWYLMDRRANSRMSTPNWNIWRGFWDPRKGSQKRLDDGPITPGQVHTLPERDITFSWFLTPSVEKPLWAS